ncbi:Uncharacterised protein [Serratia liquefaciens]|nr:hypothetical protein SFB10_1736 [Serratia liquefaciens]CAI0696099.1 Uncharacterised protein [Serratia liquefaciens]CAI0784886.1 Uncharacterised protein [Serratia liquefaciens]CAI0796271.1 Uncharacterised protein [Serratia liquefaciens]CAI0797902.1 Uncharacterised protein [Serratia liquefaciens]
MRGGLFLLAIVMLSGCSGSFGSILGVIPQSSDVCPQGKNAITGECR